MQAELVIEKSPRPKMRSECHHSNSDSLSPEPANKSGHKKSPESQQKRSPDWNQRRLQSQESQEDYQRKLDRLAKEDGVNDEDLEAYKKTALIQKCLEQVKARGKMYEEVRNSPQRYKQVRSKVRQNLKSQNKTRNAQASKTMNESTGEVYTIEVRQSLNKSQMTTQNDSKQMKHHKSQNRPSTTSRGPFDITERELLEMKNKELNSKAQRRLQAREDQIQEEQQRLAHLRAELGEQKDKLQISYKSKQSADERSAHSHQGIPSHVVPKKAKKEEVKEKIIKSEVKIEVKREKTQLEGADKQLKEIFGIAKAPNRNVELIAVLYFNIYRSLNNGRYLLDTWGDLQNHLNAKGIEKAKEELKFVEENCSKLSKPDKKKLKQALDEVHQDRKMEWMLNIMFKVTEDVKIKNKTQLKEVSSENQRTDLKEVRPSIAAQQRPSTSTNSRPSVPKEEKREVKSTLMKEEKKREVVAKSEEKVFRPVRQEKKVANGNIKEERKEAEVTGTIEFVETRQEKLEKSAEILQNAEKPKERSKTVEKHSETKSKIEKSSERQQVVQKQVEKKVEKSTERQQVKTTVTKKEEFKVTKKKQQVSQGYGGGVPSKPQQKPAIEAKVEVKVEVKASAKVEKPQEKKTEERKVQKKVSDEEMDSSYSFNEDDDKGPESFGVLVKHEKQVKKQHEEVVQNKDLEARTQQMQEEFEKVLGELNQKRKDREGEAFYKAIIDFYEEEGTKGHSSPTKRLVQQKNTTFEHKKTMKDNIDREDYSLTYVPGPGKSYVIEPVGGELNYKLAQKDPLKFYDQVFNQDIKKNTVGEDKQIKKQLDEEHKKKEEEAGSPLRKKKTKVPVTVTTKVTKRPHAKIMQKLKEKIAQKLREKIGQEFGAGILEALKEQGIEDQIKSLIKQNKLHIVDQKNQKVYEKELKEEAERKKEIAVEDEEEDIVLNLDKDAKNIASEDNSPVKTNTHLIIGDRDLNKLEVEVKKSIRRASMRQ